jgi:hypothetical protein
MAASRRQGLLRRAKAAPRMTIRHQASWPARIVLLVALLALAAGLAWLAYEIGRGMNPFRQGISAEQAQLMEQRIAALGSERERVAVALSAAESQLAIERAARQQLSSQLKSLEIENGQLQEDLSFFENLLPAGPVSQDISIRRLKLDLAAPNQLRYRLLVMRHGKAEREFSGTLQLFVELAGDASHATLTFPAKNDVTLDQFRLDFRHYQRIEGILRLPEGSQVKSVQARVFENGKLRAQQSANL